MAVVQTWNTTELVEQDKAHLLHPLSNLRALRDHGPLVMVRGEDVFLWDSDGKRYIENERLSQVWFAGVHANVGGGYPDDSLSHVALSWVMAEARKAGLRFKEDPPGYPDMVATALGGADKDGRLYDSRSGLGGYYRYGPRKLVELCHAHFSSNPNDEVTVQEPKIHWTVFERMRNEAKSIGEASGTGFAFAPSFDSAPAPTDPRVRGAIASAAASR